MTTFAPIFVPEAVREAVSDRAWLAGMLEAERALAAAEAAEGVIPGDAALQIEAACTVDAFDVSELAVRGRAAGNPAEPLVRALREHAGGDAARFVHFGATSQDVLDTAAMLVARETSALVAHELGAAAEACARLAREHRSTPMAARTLLQQAVPTTFGHSAAGWLVAILEARRRLASVRFTAQLGGAAGTLAPLGDRGAGVLRRFAAELGLDEPVVPWHAQRGRLLELVCALDGAAAACAKIALDVTLLAQTEVGEVSEHAGGGSSTLPQKRNPVLSVLARACAREVRAAASAFTAEHELDRAAGAWHAEWSALSQALAFAGGAAAAIRECLDGLEVHPERMRENLTPALTAERLAFRLGGELGRAEAHELVGRAFADGDPRVTLRGRLPDEELEELLDPTTYLGSAELFVDRALAFARDEAGT